MKGEILVELGDKVRRDQVVARTELPGNVSTVNLVNRLGITAAELPRYMLKEVGDPVRAGDSLAETRPFIKWFKTTVRSEIDGTVESVSSVTGQVMLRQPPSPVEVFAYVDGTVVDLIPEEGVVVEASGAFVQGIFGVGGECWGVVQLLTDGPEQSIDPRRISHECQGKIVVGGGLVSSETIERAREVGAAALVAGGIRDRALRDLLGYDLGVAITGAEAIGLTVVVTEGFGDIAMAVKTFDILQSCAGREASISGATQIRAGVLRPEIIVSGRATAAGADGPADEAAIGAGGGAHDGDGMKTGDPLRVIRDPYFGQIGRVSDLIPELRRIETGASVRVLEVSFEDGERAVVPRANVELIEE